MIRYASAKFRASFLYFVISAVLTLALGVLTSHMTLMGIIAQHYVSGAAAQVVGTIATATSTSGSVTPAWNGDQPRTAGHLLLLAVSLETASGTPTCGTPTGWTAITSTGTTGAAVFLFGRVATGADAAPSVSASLAGVMCWLIEVSGIAGSSISAMTDTGANGTFAGTTQPTTGSYGALIPPDFMIAVVAVRTASGFNGTVSTVWGSSYTAISTSLLAGSAGYGAIASKMLTTTTSETLTCSLSGSGISTDALLTQGFFST